MTIKYFILTKSLQKYEIWEIMIWGRGTSETLGGSLVHLFHCPKLQVVITSRWRWLEEIKHRNLERQRQLLPFKNVLIASNHPHNFLSSCCCSLLVRIFKHLDTGFGKFKPITALQIRHVPLLRLKLRLRFLNCYFGSLLLPNFNIMERELYIMGVLQSEYIFIVVCTN